MEQSIRELVERAKSGDQQAIAALYERTSRKAYYLSMQLVKDQDQAQDILQDAYLKVFTNLNMLQQPENFQGWLDTIVINKSKDYLKKKKPVLFSHMAAENEPDAEPDFEDESGYFSPEKQVDYAETKRLVQEMIDQLPEQQRMAVVLYYLENLSVGQIARMMECSEGTVKSRLNYGRKAIKAQVLALEKKGTKLYCMPLVPFLYWMFRQQVLAAAAPAAVGTAVLQAAGAGAMASGAGTAGTAGTAGAGTAAGAGTTGTVGAAGTGTAAGAGTAGVTDAAGAGAGAVGTTAAGVAGKAGLTILGKAIGVKGIAIVAAACVGVGAGAAGGVYVYRNHQAAEAAKVEAEREEEEARELAVSAAANEENGDAADREPGGYELSAEEREVLSRIYQAAEQRDYKALSEAFQPEFARLYNLQQEHFGDQYIIFDGQEISSALDGSKLAIRAVSTKAKSGNHAGQAAYHVTCYQGNFEDGVPEGELLAYRVEYRTWASRPGRAVDITLADYEHGTPVGTAATERWRMEDSGEASKQIHMEGGYTEEHFPIGMFEIGYPAGIQWAVDRNDRVIDEGSTPDMWFRVNVEYGDTDAFDALPDDMKQSRVNMETGIGYLVSDTTGEYLVDNFALVEDLEAQYAVFWSAKGSTHAEGTEGLFPFETASDDGGAREEENAEVVGNLEPEVMGPYQAAMKYPQYEPGVQDDRYYGWRVTASTYVDQAWNPVPSEVITHKDYYEITNAAIRVPYIVSADEFSQVKPGYILYMHVMDNNGVISSAEFEVLDKDSSGYYNLTKDHSGYEEAYLFPRPNGTAVICSYDSDALYTGVIYMGSLYFSKDCKVYDVNGFDSSTAPITLEAYTAEEHTMSFDNGMSGYEYGKSGDSFDLYGNPIFDPVTGLITKYAEIYTP